MLSSYKDYWDCLPLCDDVLNMVKEELKDGNTFEIPATMLANLSKSPNYNRALGFKIYCYRVGDLYRCKVTNDDRRAILRVMP